MDIVVRELISADLEEGFLETLAELADVSLTLEQAREVFGNRNQAGIKTYVAVDGPRVVGSISLLIERKFIHQGAYCGHIEDVVVHRNSKHRGIGAALVRHATAEAGKSGCYKVILNCYEDLVPFYERTGYKRHDIGMRTNVES